MNLKTVLQTLNLLTTTTKDTSGKCERANNFRASGNEKQVTQQEVTMHRSSLILKSENQEIAELACYSGEAVELQRVLSDAICSASHRTLKIK